MSDEPALNYNQWLETLKHDGARYNLHQTLLANLEVIASHVRQDQYAHCIENLKRLIAVAEELKRLSP